MIIWTLSRLGSDALPGIRSRRENDIFQQMWALKWVYTTRRSLFSQLRSCTVVHSSLSGFTKTANIAKDNYCPQETRFFPSLKTHNFSTNFLFNPSIGSLNAHWSGYHIYAVSIPWLAISEELWMPKVSFPDPPPQFFPLSPLALDAIPSIRSCRENNIFQRIWALMWVYTTRRSLFSQLRSCTVVHSSLSGFTKTANIAKDTYCLWALWKNWTSGHQKSRKNQHI